MLYDEQAARANVRNRAGRRVFFLGRDDRLTPAARDYLQGEKIQILPAEQARIEKYRLLTGGYIEEKPEHMTHLHSDVLVVKNHLRIRFRGAMDSLEAALLNCQQVTCREEVGQILDLARRLIRCEVMDEPVGEFTLCGLTEQEQRNRSHFPQDYYGIAHFMPSVGDGAAVLALNTCRCAARNAELWAVDAFLDDEGSLKRMDIVRALNRMSSMLYILMIREKAKAGK